MRRLRNRLHDTLDSPLPLIGIEATVGAGKRTLLDVAAMIGAVVLVGVGGVLLYLNRIRRTA